MQHFALLDTLRPTWVSVLMFSFCRTLDVRPCAMATAFCIIGQLVPNSAKRSNGFPFCYNSNISLIYCGCPVRLRMSDSAQWPRRFCIIGQLAPNSAECSDAFPFITFHLSFFQIYFHCCLAYPISDISQGTCI